MNVKELRAAAEETAVSAGKLAREKFLQPRQVANKGFRDVVTDADFAAQKLITDALQARFPDHAFLTEETDANLPTSGDVFWIIDPVDGTTNYSRQQPIYCVSVAAVTSQWDVLAGAVYDPMQDELFSAGAGEGCTLNGRPLHVSSVSEPGEAVVSVDWSSRHNLRQSILEDVTNFIHQVYTVRVLGSATLAMAWVAAGRFDAYLNYNLRPWDLAAAILLIQEAGGHTSDLQGQPVTWSAGGMECIISNGRIHQALLDKLFRAS